MKEKHNIQARMEKIRHALRLDRLPKAVRMAVVGVLGGIVLLAGVVMIVTPGPAFILIPLGLFMLASEFQWAQRWAQKLVDGFDKMREKWRARKKRRAAA